jgi:hypothetical protein
MIKTIYCLKYIPLALMLLLGKNLSGQHYFKYENSGEPGLPVFDQTKKPIQYAWAGGMNSCQFGEIDLNLDGIRSFHI